MYFCLIFSSSDCGIFMLTYMEYFFFFLILGKENYRIKFGATEVTLTKYWEAELAMALASERSATWTLKIWSWILWSWIKLLMFAKIGVSCQLCCWWPVYICWRDLLLLRIMTFVKPRWFAWRSPSWMAVAWARMGYWSLVLRQPTKRMFQFLSFPTNDMPCHLVLDL